MTQGTENENHNKTEDVQKKLDQLLETAREKYTAIDDIFTKIQAIKTDSQSLKTEIDTNVKSIKDVTNDLQQIDTNAKTCYQSMQDKLTGIEGKVEDIARQHNAVSQLCKTLFEDIKDENGNVTTHSLESKINSHHKLLNDEIETAKKARDEISDQFDMLRKSLEAEVRALLPNAATASLAYGYVESKAKYGALPYDEKALTKKGWSNRIQHFLKGNATSIFNHMLFFLPLLFMTWLFIRLFKDIQRPDLNGGVLLFRAAIAIPLGLISFFGWKTISLNRRMYEEYNHKQRVMQLYHGFKEEVEKHGNADMQKALISIMLDVVKDKPSLIMTQYDRGPEVSLSRSFFDNWLPSKKNSPPEQ